MHFAARTTFDFGESAYGAALRRARERGGLLDLTISNPTRCGFQPSRLLLDPLSSQDALRYDPDSLGMLSAREAVCAMYRQQHNVTVLPESLVLTSSTSEAYSYLLRLFCEPGDAILVPSPSYPLFDLLARLHDVKLIPYPLLYHDAWQVDEVALIAAVTPRTRAIVTVHPNNPTGHLCGQRDREALRRCAMACGVPLIVDEVFLDYPVESGECTSFLADTPPCDDLLMFVLGGLSKQLCLPQMKLAWMALQGPTALVEQAVARLEVIADTFLSVGTPPQLALPYWLQDGSAVADEVRLRVRQNLHLLDTLLPGTTVSRLRVDAGWTVVLRVPALESDEALAVHLMEVQSVAVHPGSFYGFPAKGWLVLSLLPQTEVLRRGIERLLQVFGTQTT